MGPCGQNSWAEAGGRRQREALLCSWMVMGTIRSIQKSLSFLLFAQDLELSACQPRRAAGFSLCTETGRQPAPGAAWPKPGLFAPHSPLTTWRVAQERDPRPRFRVPVAVPVLLLSVCVALGRPPSSCPSVSSQSCYRARGRT